MVSLLLVGCGTQNTNEFGTPPRTLPSYAYEVYWNHEFYAVSLPIPSKEVGKQIGTIQQFATNPPFIEGTWSNVFPVGTKLYMISGANPKDKIAGEKKGRYIECDVIHSPS